MTRSRTAVAGLLLIPALAAGCSSSGGGGAASSTPRSSAPGSLAPGSAAAAALKATMTKGLAGLRSAHIAVDAGVLGGRSEGDVSYVRGLATGSDITLAADKTEIVTIGSRSYAKLPAGRNTSGKPWVLVSPTTTNEFVRALASSVDISKAAASLPAVADVAGTATSVSRKGNTYHLIVEPAKASGTSLGELLAGIGQQQVPVTLVLDAQGRPTTVRIAVKIGTQSFDVVITVSAFDAPVTITPPPAAQVAS